MRSDAIRGDAVLPGPPGRGRDREGGEEGSEAEAEEKPEEGADSPVFLSLFRRSSRASRFSFSRPFPVVRFVCHYREAAETRESREATATEKESWRADKQRIQTAADG